MSRRSYKIGRERALSPIRYCDGKVMYDKRGATTAANKRFDDYMKWAQDSGVPIPHLEAQMRDAISGIEGMRLAHVLQAYIPKLRA